MSSPFLRKPPSKAELCRGEGGRGRGRREHKGRIRCSQFTEHGPGTKPSSTGHCSREEGDHVHGDPEGKSGRGSRGASHSRSTACGQRQTPNKKGPAEHRRKGIVHRGPSGLQSATHRTHKERDDPDPPEVSGGNLSTRAKGNPAVSGGTAEGKGGGGTRGADLPKSGSAWWRENLMNAANRNEIIKGRRPGQGSRRGYSFS